MQERRQRLVDLELQQLRQAIAAKEQAVFDFTTAVMAQHGANPPVMA